MDDCDETGGGALDALRAAAAATDFNDLVSQSKRIAEVLTGIAEREQHENPAVAIRAAASAARVLGDSATGVVLGEQIKQLRRDMEDHLSERKKPAPPASDDDSSLIGYDANGKAVLRPTWTRPKKQKAETDEI